MHFTVNHTNSNHVSIFVQVNLCVKYLVLAECQKSAKCYKDAVDTATRSVLICLKTSQSSGVTSQLKEQIHKWVSYKSLAIKYCEQNEAELKKRYITLFFIKNKLNKNIWSVSL